MLLQASLSDSTRQAYRRAWHLYYKYLKENGFQFSFPISDNEIATFIGYLFNKQYAASTVTSLMSALGFVHKLLIRPDPTNSMLVKKLLQGYRNLRGKKDNRLPITPSILISIIQASKNTIFNQFSRIRFIAMCSLAFHALLRVGEMTDSHNNLSLNSVLMDDKFLMLKFFSYKHSAGNTSTHKIEASPSSGHCPVLAMKNYLDMRGKTPGPLFIVKNGNPVSREIFAEELRNALSFTGLQHARFTSHSFRIGAASYLASIGKSDLQIQRAGRWSSRAFMAYVRINC